MLQESASNVPSAMGPKFRPYASSNHHVTKGRYITSNDPRGYIPVYEYPLNGQWIMMDIDDGYILWTGIWKALGNSKADIVKMIDSQPDLASLIRRVRGGYLKIQGTWMPYEVALRLARRVAWPIRDDLVPLFGPTFPSTCLSPTQPGYGQVVASAPGRRRAPRKSSLPNVSTTTNSAWSVVTPHTSEGSFEPRSSALPPSAYTSYPPRYVPYSAHSEGYQQEILPTSDRHSLSLPPSTQRDRAHSRYAPYPDPSPPPTSKPLNQEKSLALQIPSAEYTKRSSHDITLPPISPAASNRYGANSTYALPPISALEDLRGVDVNDSAAVLRRLSQNDEADFWPSRSISAKSSSSSWPTAPSTFLPPLAHRLSDPAIKYSGSSRQRLSVSSSSDDSFSSHPSPISPPSPSTPLTPQSLPPGNHYIGQLPVLREDQIGGCDEALSSATPRSRPIDQDEISSNSSGCRHDADRRGDYRQPYRPW
ncbi:hypothetical protein DFH05DRAFT_1492911 [Lentinula detonsa]|uniref:HTH APSES-type domain-containing protein n=1 Tax=Lentinula detonsa TaxID=2804962 RepID=A0A9W8NZH2_9AGAR|nr:hypothetical protein DFH05DRAFT_1492911 [Lentinula detonsa]KAJ3984705.1 hypothetical protein F5890DRAFT_1515104 [Lentinula detonsa]